MDEFCKKLGMKKQLLWFFILVAAVALGNGLSDSVYANYFKEVYHINAQQRAFIEFPRELPGLLCAMVIAGLSFLGDLKTALVAQVLAAAGLLALGVFTPSYTVMLIFLFVNSMGMHTFMPLSDSIGMSLAEKDRIGQRVGQYASVKTAMGFVAGLIVFIGFRTGLLSFHTKIKWVFLLGTAAFLFAIFAAAALIRSHAAQENTYHNKPRFVFRKEYRYYYILTVLHGVQKQIAFVFGSWVIVDLLRKGADVMSLLTITGSFLGIFFMNYLGRWMDRFGIKIMMYADALSFIVVYVIYGFVVWALSSSLLPGNGWPVMIVYLLFVLDRLSMQIGIVKSVYLKSIAVSPNDVTAALSTGISLDHIVSIVAAQFSGMIWVSWGPQWVFFLAAFFSLGNLFVAWRIPKETKCG